MSLTLEIRKKTDSVVTRRDFLMLLKKIEKMLAASGKVSLVLIKISEMRHLNKLYRKKDQATDILSFPINEGSPIPGGCREEIGDIFICPMFVRKKYEKEYQPRMRHLFVHGVLHLLGFDHKRSADVDKMEKMERKILRRC